MSAARYGSRASELVVVDELEGRGWQVTNHWSAPSGEFYLPGAGGGQLGSSWIDIAAIKNGRYPHINTVDTLTNGISPTLREMDNAKRMRTQSRALYPGARHHLSFDSEAEGPVEGRMSRPTPIFATRADLLEALEAIEAELSLAYTEASFGDSPPRVLTYQKASEIPELGSARSGNQLQERTFLIGPLEGTVAVREIPQRKGGYRYSIDQLLNPQTVGLQPGGLYGDDCLIAGQLGQSTGDPISTKIHVALLRELRRRFVPVKSYLVGGEAQSLLDRGWRLTVNSQASDAYDLQR